MMHDVGCTECLHLDRLDIVSLVSHENDLGVFWSPVEPFFEFEQARALSQIDVAQQGGLQFGSRHVIGIEKRQIKNAAKLPADSLPLRRCVGQNSKLVCHGSV